MAGGASHSKTAVKHKRVNIDILEFGSTLFNPESAVLMPAKTDDIEGRIGIKSLAAVFKQREFDPRKRILVAGHTDSDDGDKPPFDLAEARAKSVLYLLTGDIKWWSKRAEKYHLIRDYKQLLQYFRKTRWDDCYPGAANDTWDNKTKEATAKFIES